MFTTPSTPVSGRVGLVGEAVIAGVKSRVFERPLFVHGVRDEDMWWETPPQKEL